MSFKRKVEAVLVKAVGIGHIHAVLMRFCVLLLFMVSVCQAAVPLKFDSLKVGSKEYRNVTVLGYNATDLYFTSDLGINNVKLRLIDPKLQKRFNFDPKAADELERQQQKDDLQFQYSLTSNMVARAEEVALAAKQAASTSEHSLADPISEKSLLGKPAPTLKVDKWLSEKPELEGKFVLLTFWAPWSIPCRKMIPELNLLQKKFTEQLVIIGVTSEPEKAVEEMEEPRIEFASAIDRAAKLSTAANVTSIPSAILLNQKHIVLYQGHPGFLDEKKLQTLIAKAVEEAAGN